MSARPPRSIPLRDRARAAPRCAPFRSSLGVDPVGTAGAYDAFLCVEVPLPWERDISSSEPFRSLLPPGARSAAALDGTDGRRWRPVGLVPADPAAPTVAVLAMEGPRDPRGEGVVGPFRRREWRVPADDVAELCAALLGRSAEPVPPAAPDAGDGVVDLLVCTHGHRDVCCGGSGTALHAALARELQGQELGDRVRLWRCSHTGGHRFAPTGLTFPDGYAWAGLDVATALAVAGRSGPAAEVAGHCRGSSMVPAGPAQAADREGLARLGWVWAGALRTVAVEEPAGDGGGAGGGGGAVVRVAGAAGGVAVDWRVRVEEAGRVPTPDCGAPAGPDTPTEPVWRVVSVDAAAGGAGRGQ